MKDAAANAATSAAPPAPPSAAAPSAAAPPAAAATAAVTATQPAPAPAPAAAAEDVAGISDGVMNNTCNQKQQHDSRNSGSGTSTIAPSSAAAVASRGGATPLDPEAQQAVRKERRDRAREAKLAHSKSKGNSAQHQQKKKGEGGKRRWGNGRRGKSKRKSQNGDGEGKDLFDEWLGVRLAAWKGEGEGEAAAAATPARGGGGEFSARPPEGSGVDEEIDFDPSKDEIAFPSCLSALQRRQVHGWAMQLALFHASSGEEQQRHVIVSKTGVFQGKLLTRGGRTWYKEGVTAPAVKRFALQPGYEEIAGPMVAALHRFHESVQLHEPGFEKWLKDNAPAVDPLDVSGLGLEIEKAQEAFLKWPLLHEVESEYVDTPEKLAALADILESCKEFGFDLEGHNARTYHGLTCLMQISTETKDYVVDPLAEGMWDSMQLLRGPFGKADVLKIGHSIRSLDSPSLYRDFGIVVVNAIDTEEAVHALGEKHSGLGKVLENAGVRETHDIAGLKQAMQTCDWRERPLSAERILYARCDSHYLIPLWRLLRARLVAADTFSSREDAREEEELREIKRRLDADQQRKEAATREHHIIVPSAAIPIAGKSPLLKSPVRSGASSPSQQLLAQEPRMSEWDDPEDCHRRERSRSGSFFRPDLESIHESANAVRAATAGAGESGGGFELGLENALAAAFQEDDGDEEGDDDDGDLAGAGANRNRGGNGNLAHYHHLGENLMDEEDELENEEEEDDDDDEPIDEDDDEEDLWEGWGEDATAGGVEEQATGQCPLDAVAAVPLPLSAPTSPTATPGASSVWNEDERRGGDAASAGEYGGGAVANEERQIEIGFDNLDAVAAVPLPLSAPTSPTATPGASRVSNVDEGGREGADATVGIEYGGGAVAVANEGGEINDLDAAAALSLPPSAPTSPMTNPRGSPAPNGAGSLPSNSGASASPVNGGNTIAGVRGGSLRAAPAAGFHSRSGVARPIAREPEAVVLTDGVRLVWKALSRTQTAAAVLWRPAQEAKRQDSHNERHFRTAVQRLKPPRWSEVNVRVYEEIYLWRDRTARRMDDGAAYVCPGDILIDVALAMPKTLDDLRRVSAPLSPVLGHADTPEALELVRVVRVALGIPAEQEEKEEEEEGGAAGRIRGGIASRGVGGGGAGGCGGGGGGFGGAWSGLFCTRSATSVAVAAAAAAVGIAVAFSTRGRSS